MRPQAKEWELARWACIALGRLADTVDDDIKGVVIKARAVSYMQRLAKHREQAVRTAAETALEQCGVEAGASTPRSTASNR